MMKVYKGLKEQARKLGVAHFLDENLGLHDRAVEERQTICGLPIYTVSDSFGNKIVYVIRSYLFTNLKNYKNEIDYFRDEKLDEKIEDELFKFATLKKAMAAIVTQVISFDCEIESTDDGMFNASLNIVSTDIKYIDID